MRVLLRRGLGFLWGGLLILVLTGCALWPFRQEAGPLQETTLPGLLDRLDARTAGLESLRALMAVHVKGNQRFMARLSWVSPQQLRFTGFDPVGRTLFELIVAGDRVQLSAPGRPPVLLGTVESLRRSASVHKEGLPVSIGDLVRVMKALTGPALEEGEYPILEKTDAFYILHGIRVEGDRARLTRRFWFERQALHLSHQEFFQTDGSQGILLHFEDYRPTVRGDWPYRVGIEIPRKGTIVKLVFQEIRFNAPIAPEEFQLAGGGIP